MNPVRELRDAAGLTQHELALAAGTSQPTIAAYESGRKSPTWRTVERLADAVGRQASVRFFPPLTREDRRSLALHASIADRLRADPDAVLDRARASLSHMRSLHPGVDLLDEWEALLRRPLPALLSVLGDPSPRARELRHVTPFSGVLTARQRASVYRAFASAERASLVARNAS